MVAGQVLSDGGRACPPCSWVSVRMRLPLDSCWLSPPEWCWRTPFVGGTGGRPPTLPGFQNFLAVIQSLLPSSESAWLSEPSWSADSPTHCSP